MACLISPMTQIACRSSQRVARPCAGYPVPRAATLGVSSLPHPGGAAGSPNKNKKAFWQGEGGGPQPVPHDGLMASLGSRGEQNREEEEEEGRGGWVDGAGLGAEGRRDKVL